MNLQKLFELQRQLDERIEREHPRQDGEDRLAKKILALQVELGELANEARFFKYWSHDQEPRIVVREWKLYEDTIKEYGDSTHRRYEGVVRPVLRQPLLEEYVDCLHFILSIGLEAYIEDESDIQYIQESIELMRDVPFSSIIANNLILEQFNSLFKLVIEVSEDKNLYDELFKAFETLGVLLGFTWSEIEQAYMKKNAINHERQESGY